MGTLRKIALGVLAITFITFVALFGRLPALRNTPIGFLNRVISIHIPNALYAIDLRFCGGRLSASSMRFGRYLISEKHPIVMIFFLGLVTGSAALFLSSAWHQLTSGHRLFICIILPTPYLFTWLCARSTSSNITSDTLAENLALYPYDHILYHPGVICRTCNLPKPARSKHCSVCRACVSRLDHHCVWVNNCLGRDNYRWFLALVASLSVLLLYGASLGFVFMKPLLPRRKGERGIQGFLDQWSIALAREPRIGAVSFLALMTFPLAGGLFVYHVYLIWAGTTTNETAKWSDLREDMVDGIVWKSHRLHDADDHTGENDRKGRPQWPVSSDQIIVKTIDGAPPDDNDSVIGTRGDNVVQENVWKRCWSLGQVDNIYDLGFWDNLLEVLTV